MHEVFYSFDVPGASHWSFRIRRGNQITFTDIEGDANLAMLLYNPGNCLYSDMGRIFCSIIEDEVGWHETVCGNTNKAITKEKWGKLNYQEARNQWQQNGYDSFLVELAKYGLGAKDMASNVNFFSKVQVDEQGKLSLKGGHSKAGQSITLRFEMDTLVILHTCPHPLSNEEAFPRKAIGCQFSKAEALTQDDFCMNYRPENQRGFQNNQLYYLGQNA